MSSRRTGLLQASESSVVSPLVDLLFNMMITMFLFLMIYMAVVIPNKSLHLAFIDAPLPATSYHADYHANIGVRFGSGEFLFLLAEPGSVHELSIVDGHVQAPEGSSRMDLQGQATIEINPREGWLSALRIYPDGADAVAANNGVRTLPVVVVDRRERVRVAPADLERWGGASLFFYEEHEERSERADQAELESAFVAVRREFSIPVTSGSIPYDVGSNPLQVAAPRALTGIVGHALELVVPIVGGLEPYEMEVRGAGAEWLRVVDAARGALAGTPPRSGPWTIEVRIKDAQTPPGDWAAAFEQRANAGRPLAVTELTLTTKEPVLSVALQVPAYGRIGLAVQGRVLVEGGGGPFEFRPISIPPGLSLTSSGTLTGDPTQLGQFEFVIEVTDRHPVYATNDVERRTWRAALSDWRVIPRLGDPQLEHGATR